MAGTRFSSEVVEAARERAANALHGDAYEGVDPAGRSDIDTIVTAVLAEVDEVVSAEMLKAFMELRQQMKARWDQLPALSGSEYREAVAVVDDYLAATELPLPATQPGARPGETVCKGCIHGPACRVIPCVKCAKSWHSLGAIDDPFICPHCEEGI